MATLTGRTIAASYVELLKTTSASGITASLDTVQDGDATDSALQLSSGGVKSTGTLEVAGTATLSTSVTLATGATVTGIDNGDLTTGSATLLATQGAVKTYVDAQVGASDTLSEVLANGGTATSSALAGVMSDETGSGSLVFATSPTLVTPALGTPASGVATNLTGTAASLTAGTVTTNANLTGDVTSSGSNATTYNNVIPVTKGGTTLTGFTAGDILYADTTTTLAKLAKGSDADVLTLASGVPSWAESTTGDISGVTAGTNLNGGGTSGAVTLNLDNPVVANLTGNASGSSGSCTGNASTVTNGVYTTNNLSVMAATTSAQLAGVISNETGSGSLVFATSPTLVTPALGTPASGVLTSCTGTASGLTAGTVTTNANLTGDVTSMGNATTIATDAVDIAMLSATGTADSSVYLRGDNTWSAPSGTGTVTGTGADNQVAVWTSTSGIEGTSSLVFDGTNLEVGAGGAFTTASGNDLNLLIPASRSLFVKQGATTHVTVDNAGLVGIGRTPTTQKLEVEGGGYFSGSVGIGTVTPKRNLQIYNPTDSGGGVGSSTYLQLTNLSTGAASDADGFQLGLNNAGEAQVIQRENLDMAFSTNNTERLRITAAGLVGIGRTPTTHKLEVEGNGYFSTASGGELTITNSGASGVTLQQTNGGVTNSGSLKLRGGTSVSFMTNDVADRMVIDSAGRVTVKNASNSEITDLVDDATIDIDFDDANNFKLLTTSLVGNSPRELQTPSNITAGQSGCIVITQDGSGSRALTYTSAWHFEGGTDPVLSTAVDAVDTLAYYCPTDAIVQAVLLKDLK